MSGKARLTPTARRARVLAAAAEEFAEHGYDRTSLRAIAKSAGVTTPVVYDHFASKAELYAAVAEQQTAAFNAYWSQPEGDTVEALFSAAMQSIFGWIEEHPLGWRIIYGDRPSDPLVAQALAAGQSEASAALTGIFAALPGLHLPPGIEPARAHAAYAEAAKTAVNGLAAWWWENRDVPRETVIGIATALLWNGLRDLTGNPEEQS